MEKTVTFTWQMIDWEKAVAYETDKGLMFKICKHLYKLIKKNIPVGK